jgi:hypothetical protein
MRYAVSRRSRRGGFNERAPRRRTRCCNSHEDRFRKRSVQPAQSEAIHGIGFLWPVEHHGVLSAAYVAPSCLAVSFGFATWVKSELHA